MCYATGMAIVDGAGTLVLRASSMFIGDEFNLPFVRAGSRSVHDAFELPDFTLQGWFYGKAKRH